MLISEQAFAQELEILACNFAQEEARRTHRWRGPTHRAMLGALPALLLSNGVYKDNEPVTLYANKVGPFANPSEVYAYYSLPFCPPADCAHSPLGCETKREDLGPLLKGDRPTITKYSLRFKEDMPYKSLCKLDLTETMADRFKASIVDDYYFEMMLDELPIWGYVGELETKSVNFEREYDNSTRCARRAAQFRRAARNSSAPRAIPPRGVAERAPPRAAGTSSSRTSTSRSRTTTTG